MNIQNFKKFEVGGLSKDKLIEELEQADVRFNDYAHTLFEHPLFYPPDQRVCVSLVKVSLCDLGLMVPSCYGKIVEEAERLHLSICPLWLAAFLRLEYRDQEVGPYLHVASKKPSEDEGHPNGFYLRNYDEALWLRGYRASDDWEWRPDSEFIFMK